ncbi:MAG: molybdopterin-dependent oxidoreductase [Promethearchaeota archaeon]
MKGTDKRTVTIDGKLVDLAGREGKTVLEVAREEGIYIPTLCSHPDLPPYGACRLCIVEIEGVRGHPTSCTTPIRVGMVIRTRSPEIDQLRRDILELIFTEHPYFCLTCDQRDECREFYECPTKAGRVTGCNFCHNRDICELRQLAEDLGLEGVRFGFHYKDLPLERDDPFIERDMNLCILCGRCVRICSEVRGFSALAFVNRGNDTRISTAFDKPRLYGSCQFCGACIDVCPTGAIYSHSAKWLLPASDRVESSCVLCSMGCGIQVDARGGKLLGVSPGFEKPGYTGHLCVYGRFTLPPLMNSRRRLKYPMVRVGETLVPTSWDEALAKAAQAIGEYPQDDVGAVLSPFISNEAARSLARIVTGGSKGGKLWVSGRYDLSALVRPVTEGLGGLDSVNDTSNLEGADLVIIVGSRHLFYSTVSVSLHAARRAGAKIAIVDPCASEVSRWADLEVNLHSNRVKALFTTLLVDIAGQGVASWKSPASQHGGAREFRDFLESVRDRTPNYIGATGVESERYESLVGLVRGAERPHVILGDEFLSGSDASDLVALAIDLLLVKGNPGGLSLLHEGGNLAGVVAAPPDGASFSPLGETGHVKALIMTEFVGGFARLKPEFTLLVDTHESPALERADIVLPAAAFTESGGTYTKPGGRGQFTTSKIVDPPGEARPEQEIFEALGRLLGIPGLDGEWAGAAAGKEGNRHHRFLVPRDFGGLTTPTDPNPMPIRYRSVVIEDIVEDLALLNLARNTCVDPETPTRPTGRGHETREVGP